MDFSGNSSRNFTRSWHPEPTTRGSFTILSSCIITLTLCVWKAVHLNLPEHESCLPKRKKTDLRYWMTQWVALQMWRKVGWLMLGIFAPEMVAFTAWSQRREAQNLKKVMVQELSRTPPSPDHDIELGQLDQTQPPMADDCDTEHSNRVQPPADDEIEMGHSNQAQPPTDDETKMENSIREARAYFKRNPWTITHGFYAVMGGYAIDTSALPVEQKFLPGNRDRLALTPDGLEFLAKHRPDLIPRVSRAEIQDKSKADTFAKSIIFVQASFFIVQCLYRLIQHLPISLLELNTFGHTIFALLSYAFWWKKPLEVSEPTLISVGESRELWAAFCFCSSFRERLTKDSELFCHVTTKYDLTFQLENTDLERGLGPGDQFGNLRYREPPHWLKSEYRCQRYWTYTPRDRIRWSLVSSCVDGPPWKLTSKFRTRTTTGWLRQDTVADRAKNWPPSLSGRLDNNLTNRPFIEWLVAFTLAGLSYGVLHLLAWNYPFASYTEHLLWQISGLTIAASGPAFLFLRLLGLLVDQFDKFPYKQGWDAFLSPFTSAIFLCFLGPYSLLYMFSRGYLIVESFVSFTYLPDSAFQQAQWTYYVPHIS